MVCDDKIAWSRDRPADVSGGPLQTCSDLDGIRIIDRFLQANGTDAVHVLYLSIKCCPHRSNEPAGVQENGRRGGLTQDFRERTADDHAIARP